MRWKRAAHLDRAESKSKVRYRDLDPPRREIQSRKVTGAVRILDPRMIKGLTIGPVEIEVEIEEEVFVISREYDSEDQMRSGTTVKEYRWTDPIGIEVG